MTTSFLGILIITISFPLKLEPLILLNEARNLLHHFVGPTRGVKFYVQKFLCYLLCELLLTHFWPMVPMFPNGNIGHKWVNDVVNPLLSR